MPPKGSEPTVRLRSVSRDTQDILMQALPHCWIAEDSFSQQLHADLSQDEEKQHILHYARYQWAWREERMLCGTLAVKCGEGAALPPAAFSLGV